MGSAPSREEWWDVWDAGRKVWLLSKRLRMASSSTRASSGGLTLLLPEPGEEGQELCQRHCNDWLKRADDFISTVELN